ncbi:MAG: FeoB-associated Cys-rich membrane protein [Clostridia bacterium]|nr:FeoB-associated Cys-rich membrane protein [Clostridia bacterium]MBQ1554710.1 FeoB-associated Cys-rich membrane protein [Clostridia bacterium]
MLDFLTANLGNIIVLAVLLLAVVLIIISMRRDRKNGKSSCGCSCANCPSAGICHKN